MKIKKISLSEIKKTQPQREHGDIEKLKDSIIEVGLINPITINENNELLAGRRRFQAIKELGWSEVDCRILPSENGLKDLKVSIDENLKRKSLTDVEVANAINEYDELKRKIFGSSPAHRHNNSSICDELWNTDKTAKDLGISSGSVRQAIQITKAIKEKPELVKFKGSQILRKVKIEKQKEKIKTLEKPTGLFDVIIADPPWPFLKEYDPDFARSAGDYPSMSIEEIKAIQLPAKKDCVLWLWITNNHIKESFEVLEAWGFTYRAILTWDKEIMGIGRWLRNQTEHCLMATKGNPIIDLTNQTTIIREKRTIHSQKPEIFYDLVDKLCIGEKLDYFARKHREGYVCYGDEL